jgi:ribosome-binding protein aMBF1 (putative translation factor)
MRGSTPQSTALLGMYHRTIHIVQRPQNKLFLLRKPLSATPTSFGERLRVARIAQGCTQTEIARKFGISLSAVKFWEQNGFQPTSSIGLQIEAFLKPLQT